MQKNGLIMGLIGIGGGAVLVYLWSHFYGPATTASERIIRVIVIAVIVFLIALAIQSRAKK